MTKNKNGNNRDGLGIMDLMYLAKNHPVKYWFTILAIHVGLIGLAKRILDVK